MSNDTLKALQAAYDKLTAKRDAINENVQSIKDALAEKHDVINAAQDEIAALVKQLNDNRGGNDWLVLKKEIGKYATAIQALK